MRHDKNQQVHKLPVHVLEVDVPKDKKDHAQCFAILNLNISTCMLYASHTWAWRSFIQFKHVFAYAQASSLNTYTA